MDVSKIAIQIASEFTGSKAFKQAETSTQKLQKQVSSLAKTLGIALGTAAIVKFGKASVKAFAADDNAARSLSKTLENLGLNTRYAGSTLNGYISRLEKQTGVLDDELRPAMDRLLRATGSVTKSQEGQDRYTTEIIADQMQMLGGREGGGGSSSYDASDEDQSRPQQTSRPAPAQQPASGGDFDAFEDDIPF